MTLNLIIKRTAHGRERLQKFLIFLDTLIRGDYITLNITKIVRTVHKPKNIFVPII